MDGPGVGASIGGLGVGASFDGPGIGAPFDGAAVVYCLEQSFSWQTHVPS